MVNKAVVGVIGVVLITTLGVGALVGLQGGGGPADDASPNANDGNGNDDGNAETPPEEQSPADDPEQTRQPSESTPVDHDVTIRSSDFTRQEIEENVTVEINEWRAAEGQGSLQFSGSATSNNLQAMARAHSDRMAAAKLTAHTIGNSTIEDRYRTNDGLYHTCGFEPPGENYIAQPGDANPQTFEWIASTEAASSFSEQEGIRFHQTESSVATELVEQWRGAEHVDNGLLSANYRPAGVGVNVTRDGTVYATVHLCGK